MQNNVPTDIDYTGILDSLRLYLRGDNKFSDLDFEASGISSIAKLLAANSSGATLNAILALNESFSSTSENLGNVQALVTPESGYVPRGVSSARITADIIVTPPDPLTAPATLTLPRTFTGTGVGETGTYTFSPLSAVTTSLQGGVYTFTNVVLAEGQLVTDSFEKQGDSVEDFLIQNRNIDISTLSVIVQSSAIDTTTAEWTRFTSAFQLGSAETLYYLSMNRKGNYKLGFGDNAFSAALSGGNLVYASYVVSNGEAGNGISSLIATAQVGDFTNVTINHTNPSSGGAPAETIESIKLNARTGQSIDGVAVSDEQHTAVLSNLLPSHKVNAFGGEKASPKRPGFVLISTSPALSEAEQATAIAALERVSVGSTIVAYVDATVYTVTLDTFFVADGSTNVNTDLNKEATSVVSDYIASHSVFGGSVEPDELQTLVKAVSGINRAYVNYKMSAPVVVSTSSATMNYRRQILSGSFRATVTGATFSEIRDTGSGFYGFTGDVQGEQLLVSADYASGLITITLPVGAVIQTNEVSPAGDDLKVQVGDNELLAIVDGGVRP